MPCDKSVSLLQMLSFTTTGIRLCHMVNIVTLQVPVIVVSTRTYADISFNY